MTPAPRDGFVATGPLRRARKSAIELGTFRGAPAVAKRLVRDTPVWRWYFAREAAVYRALAGASLPVRVPRLLAVDDTAIILEYMPGEPLATRRAPDAELPAATLAQLAVAFDALAAVRVGVPLDAPTPRVLAQLRARLLEDPTDSTWIARGAARCAKLGLLPARIADDVSVLPVAFAHGDALLRNIISGEQLAVVDWECAGPHPAGWDRALLYTQLGPAARAAFPANAALVAFALAREIRFLRSFRVSDRHPELVRRHAELARILER